MVLLDDVVEILVRANLEVAPAGVLTLRPSAPRRQAIVRNAFFFAATAACYAKPEVVTSDALPNLGQVPPWLHLSNLGKCQMFPSNRRFRNLSPTFPTSLTTRSNLSVLPSVHDRDRYCWHQHTPSANSNSRMNRKPASRAAVASSEPPKMRGSLPTIT